MKPQRYVQGVAAVLDREFRSGGTVPDLSDYAEIVEESVGLEDVPVDVDLELVRSLTRHGSAQGWSDNELDQWLAPRLHFALRIPRRVAGDRGFWTWLAIDGGNEYVLERWKGKSKQNPDTVTMHRYTGGLLRNALARLWWGAELVRNGPSYENAHHVFNRVWTAEYALELRYSWYRPAAIAFTRVGEGVDGGRPLGTSEMKDLSKKVNSYLSLRALEVLGLQKDSDEEVDYSWLARHPSLAETLEADSLKGPQDGYAETEAVEGLEKWFRSLVAEVAMEEDAA